jgi:hypothetical protein
MIRVFMEMHGCTTFDVSSWHNGLSKQVWGGAGVKGFQLKRDKGRWRFNMYIVIEEVLLTQVAIS